MNMASSSSSSSSSSSTTAMSSLQAELTSLVKERDDLQAELQDLERRQRSAVASQQPQDNGGSGGNGPQQQQPPSLQQQYQHWTKLTRQAQEELGVIRRQNLMCQQQEVQLRKILTADRKALEEVVQQEQRLQQQEKEHQQAFIKEMEKRNERLARTMSQAEDQRRAGLLTVDTIPILLTQLADYKENYNSSNHPPTTTTTTTTLHHHRCDNNAIMMMDKVETSLLGLQEALVRFDRATETNDRYEDGLAEIRSFLLNRHVDPKNDAAVPITEEELMELEHEWERQRRQQRQQQQPSEHADASNDNNHDIMEEIDEDRLLMPPPPTPVHMQLFYSSQQSNPTDDMNANQISNDGDDAVAE